MNEIVVFKSKTNKPTDVNLPEIERFTEGIGIQISNKNESVLPDINYLSKLG